LGINRHVCCPFLMLPLLLLLLLLFLLLLLVDVIWS
jgi:hypothetical protein